jgi:hypothetical protein
MVEHQMRASILAVASFWYSAWVDAGQPNLTDFKPGILVSEEQKSIKKEEKSFRKGKIIGREEQH